MKVYVKKKSIYNVKFNKDRSLYIFKLNLENK